MGNFFDTLQRSQPDIDRVTGFLQMARAKQKENERRQRLQDFFAAKTSLAPAQEENAREINNQPATPVDMNDRQARLQQAMAGGMSQGQTAPAQTVTPPDQTVTTQKDIGNLSTEDVLGLNKILEGPASQGLAMAQQNAVQKRAALEAQMKAKREGRLVVPRGADVLNLDTGKIEATNTNLSGTRSDLFQSFLAKNGGDTEAALADYDNYQKGLIAARGEEARKTQAAKPPAGTANVSDADIDAVAEKLAHYKIPLSQLSRTGGMREKALARAIEKNPNIDIKNYDNQQRMMQSFSSGKYAQNITSLNTAIGHLGTLHDAATAMSNGDLPALNTIANYYKKATGQSAPDVFNTVKDAVVNELATTFKGSSGTDVGVKSMSETIRAAQSPQQLSDVVKSYVKLLGSRLDALNNTYKKTMNEDFPVLDDHSKNILNTLTGGGAEEDQQAIDWAKKNPKDPNSAAILKLHGITQ